MITNEQLKNKLNNKLILITGAAGGIGYETAKDLAFMGAKVIILDIAVEKGNYAKDSINNDRLSIQVQHSYEKNFLSASKGVR